MDRRNEQLRTVCVLVVRFLLSVVLGSGLYWLVILALVKSSVSLLQLAGVWLSWFSIFGWLFWVACIGFCFFQLRKTVR